MIIDPATLEVIRNGLFSIAEEMGVSLVRTGYSTSIKERRDCSCSIYDLHGRMAAQAEHIPLHLGVMPSAVKQILNLYPVKQMSPGDMFILNDPYLGGNHLPDIIMVAPIYHDSDLIGFAGNMAHQSDLGGMRPRSMAGDAEEIYQEGLRIPGMKLVSCGKVDQHQMRLLTANSRTPDFLEGDLNAQISANMLAHRRVGELCQKYGGETVKACIETILNRSEQQMKAALEKIPDGRFSGKSYMDDGSEIIVTAIFHGGNLTLDFTGTCPQTKTPVNAAPAATTASVMYAVKSLVAPTISANEGAFRPIETIAPPGTIVNPVLPAAVAASIEVGKKIVEAIFDAMGQAFPERIIGGSGTGGAWSFGGYDLVQKKAYTFGGGLGGGFGASIGKDGESAVHPSLSNSKITPAEVVEMSYPVRVVRCALRVDSEGAGKYRGGFGFCRAFEMLEDNIVWSTQTSMTTQPPVGRFGGLSGTGSVCIVNPGTEKERILDAYCTTVLNKGDVIEIRTAGGGGYGDPRERAPEAICEDVINGLISPERAASIYGYQFDDK